MASNSLFFAWNRAIPGREQISSTHFDEFVKYLGDLKQKGTIQSFDAVFLDWHGGDLNGFIFIRGEPKNLDALLGTDEWQNHILRAAIHLEGVGVVRAFTGEAAMSRMAAWRKYALQ